MRLICAWAVKQARRTRDSEGVVIREVKWTRLDGLYSGYKAGVGNQMDDKTKSGRARVEGNRE